MSEKLSERLIDTLQTVYALGVSRGSPAANSIREAIAIVRAVETAPECVVESAKEFDDAERPVLNVLIKLGKRVKLVEVER